jgi:hypothetical protein
MARKPMTRRRVLIAVLVVAAIGMGCNPFLVPFQMVGLLNNPKAPTQFNFYDRAVQLKKKKELRVVVLAYRGNGLSQDYFDADRTLASAFVRKLDETFKMNKERVTIVPLKDVESYKRSCDDWDQKPPSEIGKHFHADFVIDMELAQLSLYEPGARDIFHGHCLIPITIIDVENPGEPFDHFDYDSEYPGSGQSVPMDMETNAQKFKAKFLAKIAIDLTGMFSPLPTAANRFQ